MRGKEGSGVCRGPLVVRWKIDVSKRIRSIKHIYLSTLCIKKHCLKNLNRIIKVLNSDKIKENNVLL